MKTFKNNAKSEIYLVTIQKTVIQWRAFAFVDNSSICTFYGQLLSHRRLYVCTEADHQIYGCMTRVVARNTCIIFRKDALDKGEDGE